MEQLQENLALAGRTRHITWRAVAIGTLAITLICALVNYNDHVVVNTFLIGSYLPLALVLILFVLTILVNGVLHRFRPTSALTSQELSVILLMTVLGCGIPAQGFYRFFLPLLLGPFRDAGTNPTFWKAFVAADLPDWLFPVRIAEGKNNPIINDFLARVQPGQPIPYWAWVKPFMSWGIFIIAWLTTLLSLIWTFRRQWSVNERLPFPIATMEAALIAEPPKGKALNSLLGSRLFWAGVAVVFIWQSSGALNKYFPRNVPALPLRYDLGKIMADEPWYHFGPAVKAATIYFTFIGIAYFIQTRIAFSLWASFLIAQVVLVQIRMKHGEITDQAWRDQHLGACISFIIGFLWIGRHHLLAVGRQLVGRPGGTALTAQENYRPAAILFLTGLATMAAWLLFLGVHWYFAAGLLAIVVGSHLITARVVAETGLPFVRCDITTYQIFTNIPVKWMSTRDLFFAAGMYIFGPVTTRESAAVFGQNGLVVADDSGLDTARSGRKLALVMVWALLVAIGVTYFAALWTHYTYATPIAVRVQHPMLDPPAMDRPRSELIDPIVRHSEGAFAPQKHSPLVHVSLGLGITAVLQFLSLRSASWPFLPVGYLLCTRWFIGTAWFSLMLGWLAKVLILKFGGASMYQKARPLFIGAIFGEALAAGVWMLISLALAWSGCDYQSVPMLPN